MTEGDNDLGMSYDRDADVLYVTRGRPEYTDYVEYGEDLVLRFEPETHRLVGFTIIDFSKHFGASRSDIRLPFGVTFEVDEALAASGG